jgi:DNA-directed RNA polymerase subunit M/transcription elongation factor TFIIS
MKKWLKAISDFFRAECPSCKGKMNSVFEMELDTLLYTCDDCGTKWI